MKIVALAGGVGGAKLVDGLARVLSPQDLTVIVNTGDDFKHLGLSISPDLDTVCYTLAGIANPETGWGRINESYRVMENLQVLDGPSWFRLGDQDLATHLERTRRLKIGQTLGEITRFFCRSWGVKQKVLPMSDQQVSTLVETLHDGDMPFQEYFVHRQCTPEVKGFRFSGIEEARTSPGVLEAINVSDGVVICPSNPWVSIAPILAVPGLRSAIEEKLIVSVSPIISGHAIKGPAAKMYTEMGFQPSALAVARHYGTLLSGFVMDILDEELTGQLTIPVRTTEILMKDQEDRRRLAQDVLNFIRML